LASKVKVADKTPPALAGMSAAQTDIFKGDPVVFQQANLSRETFVKKAFEDGPYQIVFNLAGNSSYGQSPEVYKENVVDVAKLCGKVAAEQGALFIHVSTAQVYDSEKKARVETDKIKPWTKLGEAHYKAEQELNAISGLKLIIVRPAIVYGPGDLTGITPRIVVGAVYKHSKEKMELLWDGDLAINTVHVDDVSRALWHLSKSGKPGEVYNLADSASSNQGSICKLLEEMYGIKTDFKGNIASKLATAVAMKDVAETANEMHLQPWSEICKANGIVHTPLTPYLAEELLYNNHTSVNGTKITSTGFKYEHPAPNAEDFKKIVAHFQELKQRDFTGISDSNNELFRRLGIPKRSAYRILASESVNPSDRTFHNQPDVMQKSMQTSG